MPILEFLLTNNQLTYSAEKDSEEWILVPDAKLQKNYDSFEVFLGSDKYDGFSLECNVIIEQRTPKNIARAERLARIAQQASDGKLAETVIEGCLGTIALGYSREHEIPPHFEIIVLLPTDAFFRMQAYLETSLCYLSIKTDPFESGLIHGDDPNGKDIQWLVDKVNGWSIKLRSPLQNPYPYGSNRIPQMPARQPDDVSS